ncbi:MAG TPA: LpqB family beta-propeller domain-containing protein [Candidatus Aquilonibacter sp.]|nr:LpqB family beta-propeller domain-containing protein [Candidatus Aquilonibacter sp.]
MSVTSPTPLSAKPSKDRLDSWKEIAEYLRRDVTTVQRWEKREGMPVHRQLHDKIGSVYAYPADLDAWVHSRSAKRTMAGGDTAGVAEEAPRLAAPKPRRWFVLGAAVIVATLGIAAAIWFWRTEYFWRSPLANAQFQRVTNFDGVAEAAAISRDGQFIAFLSDRDGQMDVWVTQVGSGEFHNLTRGAAPELINPSVRALRFSPDGSMVMFWAREQAGQSDAGINIWTVPTLGGQPRPYLRGAAEVDWSPDGARFAYHTPGPGDPLFVSDGRPGSQGRLILTAPAGLHSHFPLWSSDSSFIYFVRGSLPDHLDIWRIRPGGGAAERITSQNVAVSHPVVLDRNTLMYLASDPDGSGPWLYSIDVNRRIPHQLTAGPDRYTSLAASADGRRLVLTLADPKNTLWRLRLNDSPIEDSPARIPLTTSTGIAPRLGPNFLLYVSATDSGDSIWKLVKGAATQLWNGQGARVLAGPAISPDGASVAFATMENARSILYTMQADGTNVRIVTDSLNLQGSPTWSPDGKSITVAVDDHGTPHLMRVALDGRSAASLTKEYSVDPVWSPDGSYVVYSGADIGTSFSLKAITPDATAHSLPALTMTRGARRVAFVNDGRAIVILQGEIQHKDLWLVDLTTGSQRQLTKLPADFDVRDFDISPDGHDVVFERAQAHSDVVLFNLPRR